MRQANAVRPLDEHGIAGPDQVLQPLHRSRVGGLELPAELAPGQWRWLEAEDLARLADYTDPEA